MSPISVIAGPASVDLATRISKKMGSDLIVPEVRTFSDGESKIRFPRIMGPCAVVQSAYPPVDTHLLQAMMMATKSADDGAGEICAVIPYLGYARQDRAFLEGELVTISLVAKLLAASGFTSVITVDIHSQLGLSRFSPLKIINVSSVPLLASYAKSMDLKDPIAVSPDAGGAARVSEFSKHFRIETLVLEKTRNRMTGEVSVAVPNRDLAGRDAVLVDDMISSGGSIIAAAQALRSKGARRVYAICAHALLLGGAPDKLAKAGVAEIIATNSIPNDYAKVDLSEAISAELLELFKK